MNKVLLKGVISLFLAVVLLLSMTATAAAIDEEGWEAIEEAGFEKGSIVWDLDSEIAGKATEPDWTSSGDNQASAFFGQYVASAGDVNNNGYDDVLVTAGGYDTPTVADVGKVYLYLGSALGSGTTAAWTAVGEKPSNYGDAIASAGDVNGDGYDDIIIGAPGYPPRAGGKVYVYHGSATGPGTTPDWEKEGPYSNWENYGFAVASGDVNNDGYDDVVVAASWRNPSHDGAGTVFLYLGGPTGLGDTPVWISSGDNVAYMQFGHAVALGDVNDDDYDDLLVGAPGYGDDKIGRIFLFLGSSSGLATTSISTSKGDEQPGARYGERVALSDVNNDDFADAIVAAPSYDTLNTNAGKVYVYLGSASGLSATPGWTSSGDDQAYSYFGKSLSAGDVNGDSYADIIVGHPEYDTTNTDAGKAYIYLGSPSGPSTAPIWTSSGDNQAAACYGCSVASAGDVNSDGVDDVLVGASGYDTLTAVNAGKAYLYLKICHQMEKVGGPGDDGQSGSVTIEQDKSVVWIADEAAKCDVTFPATTWYGILESPGAGSCRVWVGKWNGGFSPSDLNDYQDVALSSLSVWWINVSELTVEEGEYLAFKIENTGYSDLTIVTDGSSGVVYPADEPAYPIPELSTILLFGVGLAGLGAWFGLRRRKDRTS